MNSSNRLSYYNHCNSSNCMSAAIVSYFIFISVRITRDECQSILCSMKGKEENELTKVATKCKVGVSCSQRVNVQHDKEHNKRIEEMLKVGEKISIKSTSLFLRAGQEPK